MGPNADIQKAPENFGGQASGVMAPGGAGMVRRNLNPRQFGGDMGGAAYGGQGGTLQPSMMAGAGI